MNLQSAAIAVPGNPLKSRFEFEIRAKIFSKSANLFANSPPSLSIQIPVMFTSGEGGAEKQ